MVIDRLEKEWFYLKKEVAKVRKEEVILPEDSICSICNDGECENSNAIVFCDGCNLAVHQDCYGIPFIPEGQWLCRRCMLSPGKPLSCIFCPSVTGAFKKTTTNRWAHSLCALWIPEIGVSNPVYMEPIDCIDKIPKSRWKLICYICRKKMGCCIQCANKFCFTPFHVTCARRAKLVMKIKATGGEHVEMAAYCDKHTPKELIGGDEGVGGDSWASLTTLQDEFAKGGGKGGITLEPEVIHVNATAIKKKDLLLNMEHVVPHHIYTRVLGSTRAKISKRANVVVAICKYWALKREAGRGAPLLKRLHLEPWTSTGTVIRKEDVKEMQLKLDILHNLRNDLERVRLLSDLVMKREKKKLASAIAVQNYFEILLAPLSRVFRDILGKMKSVDREEMFARPVQLEIAPDYLVIVKNPMDLQTMMSKVEAFDYDSLDEFAHDLLLIPINCMLYNQPSTHYYKHAAKFKKVAGELLARARETGILVHSVDMESGVLPFEIDSSMIEYGMPDGGYQTSIFKYMEREEKEVVPVVLESVVAPVVVASEASETVTATSKPSLNKLNKFIPKSKPIAPSSPPLLRNRAPKVKSITSIPPPILTTIERHAGTRIAAAGTSGTNALDGIGARGKRRRRSEKALGVYASVFEQIPIGEFLEDSRALKDIIRDVRGRRRSRR